MSDTLVVLVTAPDVDTAAHIARTVVEERVAACGNLLPGLRSVYRWEGRVMDEPEVLLVLKTTHAGFEALRDRIVALHPYDCPEILALPVAAAHTAYAEWVRAQVG